VNVLVQPALPSYACTPDEWSASDPNIRRVGGANIVDGVGQINLVDVPPLSDVYGQRVCVVVVGYRSYVDPACSAQYAVLYDWWLQYGGTPPVPCEPTDHVSSEVVASALLTVAQPPTPTPTAPAASTPAPASVSSTSIATSCRVPRLQGMTLRQAKTALARARCTLGHVSRPKYDTRNHVLRVRAQSPAPGSARRIGYRVNVTLR
jgi:hypothetical protein